MKVILVCKYRDYANVGYRLAQSLVRVGVDAVMYTERSAAHGYTHHGIVFDKDKQIVSEAAKDADVILFVHGRYIELDIDLTDKIVAVYHGASNYRNRAEEINEIFNPIVDVTLIQTGDLLGLGAKNEKWITACVDTTNIEPAYKTRRSDKLLVGHYPSSRKKGTANIIEILDGIECVNFVCDTTLVPHEDHIKRMSETDAYIDQFILKNPPGRKMGTPGLASFEAAALGRIPIANFLDVDLYEELYGECAIQVANTSDELIGVMERLSLLNSTELLELQHKSRAWVEKYHSYEAMGERLVKIFDTIQFQNT